MFNPMFNPAEPPKHEPSEFDLKLAGILGKLSIVRRCGGLTEQAQDLLSELQTVLESRFPVYGKKQDGISCSINPGMAPYRVSEATSKAKGHAALDRMFEEADDLKWVNAGE